MGPPIMASKNQELDVIESWEDIDEIEDLRDGFKNLIVSPSKSIETKSNGSLSSNNAPVKIILTGDDALRTQYVPPEPTVKILKRPSKDSQISNDSKVIQPKKTLQQREQEYAKARLRILGEASASERTDEKISIINKSRPLELENVIRMPRGPDGSKGFTIRR